MANDSSAVEQLKKGLMCLRLEVASEIVDDLSRLAAQALADAAEQARAEGAAERARLVAALRKVEWIADEELQRDECRQCGAFKNAWPEDAPRIHKPECVYALLTGAADA